MTREPLTTEQRRQSRIKQTKDLILAERLSGLLNNTKWHEIFEWIEESRTEFEIKLLSETEPLHSDFIRELEDSSVLVDDKGGFVEFLEIESVTIKNDKKSIEYLDNLRVEYTAHADDLTILGYR
jgi:hypothetical protein